MPEWHLEKIFEEELPEVEDFRGKPLLVLIFSLGVACVISVFVGDKGIP